MIILEKGYPFKKKTPRKPKPPKPGAKPRKTKPRKPASEFHPDMGPVHKIRLSPSPLWGNGKKCAGDVFFGGTLTATGPVRIADRTEVIEQLAADGYLKEDAQILWDKTVGSFHMLVRMRRTKPADSDPEGRRKTVVSLDPGCRSFNVYYDRTGRHGELLSGAEEGINARCKRIDGLCAQHSKLAKAKHLTRQVRRRRKRRVRKTLARERKSMRNWMRNAHYFGYTKNTHDPLQPMRVRGSRGGRARAFSFFHSVKIYIYHKRMPDNQITSRATRVRREGRVTSTRPHPRGSYGRTGKNCGE